jgi:hypothetical protein
MTLARLADFGDRRRTCSACHREFIWTLAEQLFYSQKHWVAPARCEHCRQQRALERAAEPSRDVPG